MPTRAGRRHQLHSAETKHYPVKGQEDFTAAERIVAKYWAPFEALGLPKGVARKAVPVMVNGGRWIVRCPFCPSAQNASKLDHRFFCVECGNIDVGGKWVKVIWPDDWEQIEIALFRRPKMQYRNWLPGETLDDLAMQDVEAFGLAQGKILKPSEVSG